MFAEVIVDVLTSNVDKIFDYRLTNTDAVEGSRVIVPFGNQKIEGYIIKIKNTANYDESKLKNIIRVVENIPALTKECLELTDYMHEKYHITRASILRLFLPTEMRKGKVRQKNVDFCELYNNDIQLILKEIKPNAQNQVGIIKYLSENGKAKVSIINSMFSSSSLNSLKEKGYIKITTERENRLPYKDLAYVDNVVSLTEEQQNAINVLHNSSKPVLIHGVTGSGKTEVYLRLIEDVINEGKTAIMLVPEISLTPQMLSRLRGRFKNNCAILHSGLSAGEKFDEWWRLRSGEAKIAVGARSAIFAPLENLGLIIIDEEHDSSYESESSPRYITSDIALFRQKYNNCKLVLGSATPKIESYNLAQKGVYTLCEMTKRVNGKPLPEVIIADMREEVRNGNPSAFSNPLRVELDNTLKNHNQAIIFLNRRGYSQKVICRECGYVAKCENCDVTLTYHSTENLLKCHYCGATYKMLDACPDCGGVNIHYSGTGTQKVVEELQKIYSDAKILRMDNDTTQNKESHFKILKEFLDRKADILVGTQMIAKGHDFPYVTLVGILDADMSLYFSDYRAGERTFQLITQVAGRSGRANNKGKVVLQTYNPNNPILNMAIKYDYKSFYDKECSLREATYFPPFADIIRIMVESDEDSLALETLKNVYFACKEVYDKYQQDFVYFNKMRSPIKRMKNKYRYQVLARVINNRRKIEDLFYEISNKNNSKKVNCYTEINPGSMS